MRTVRKTSLDGPPVLEEESHPKNVVISTGKSIVDILLLAVSVFVAEKNESLLDQARGGSFGTDPSYIDPAVAFLIVVAHCVHPGIMSGTGREGPRWRQALTATDSYSAVEPAEKVLTGAP